MLGLCIALLLFRARESSPDLDLPDVLLLVGCLCVFWEFAARWRSSGSSLRLGQPPRTWRRIAVGLAAVAFAASVAIVGLALTSWPFTWRMQRGLDSAKAFLEGGRLIDIVEGTPLVRLPADAGVVVATDLDDERVVGYWRFSGAPVPGELRMGNEGQIQMKVGWRRALSPEWHAAVWNASK
jgi:hypothetical protein